MAGIYVHIPFCKKACHYCNFHFSTQLERKDELFEALLIEVQLQKDYLNGEPVQSIYLGGGTPSLLSIDQLNHLFDTIQANFNLADQLEHTLEANPDDLTNEYLEALKQTYVNRLSIGVQTFYEDELAWMNRTHTAIQAERCIKAAQDKGFRNITIDLMYGYPALSNERWLKNLEKVTEYQIPHFSAYCLTVESNTALEHQITTGKQKPMDQELAANQFQMLQEIAVRNGWYHYEISNIAANEKYIAIHNSNYWKGKKYLGIGPAAHSFNGETRHWNVKNNIKYIQALRSRLPDPEVETLSNTDKANEYIMTSLRTIWGCDVKKIEHLLHHRPNNNWLKMIIKYQKMDYLIHESGKVALTQKGRLFADRIASDLFFTE